MRYFHISIDSRLANTENLIKTLGDIDYNTQNIEEKDSLENKPNSLVVLKINSDVFNGIMDDHIRLAFILKDFGVERIMICHPSDMPYSFSSKSFRRNYSHYYFGLFNESEISDLKFFSGALHISDFLKIYPDSSIVPVRKHFFYGYQEYIEINESQFEAYDWERDAIDSAYEGDASNMWNTY